MSLKEAVWTNYCSQFQRNPPPSLLITFSRPAVCATFLIFHTDLFQRAQPWGMSKLLTLQLENGAKDQSRDLWEESRGPSHSQGCYEEAKGTPLRRLPELSTWGHIVPRGHHDLSSLCTCSYWLVLVLQRNMKTRATFGGLKYFNIYLESHQNPISGDLK